MVYPVRKVSRGNTFEQDTNMAEEWNQDNKRKNSVPAMDGDVDWQDVSQEKPSLNTVPQYY